MLAPAASATARVDHLLIAEMVAAGSRVLDVGCGDGALLQLLSDTKNVDGRGIEVSRDRVNACVARGLSVIQGDADRDLADYPDGAFDYAILSLTIQATRQPKPVLEQLLRIGRRAGPLLTARAHKSSAILSQASAGIRPWYFSTTLPLLSIRKLAGSCGCGPMLSR